MFLACVSQYIPFVYIRDLLPINFDSASPEWLYIPKRLNSCKYFFPSSEELRKEARQLKRELLEAKQKKEEQTLKPKEKEGKKRRVQQMLFRSPVNIAVLSFFSRFIFINAFICIIEDDILSKQMAFGFFFPEN